ncbi:MAG TPA: uracil-DNA glycosylase family protein, partial [Terriglobales bacterium]|nr:uracil-DNA glycosylase family protein [Terriglobales bacterium]
MRQPDERENLLALEISLRCYLERRLRSGIRFVPTYSPSGGVLKVKDLQSGTEGELFSDLSAAHASQNLDELRDTIGDCRRCKLWSGRTHVVFGVGNPRAKLMFIGEGPGRDEDLQGEPFVGRA